jgi:amphi-Trp domain-containing protein
MAEQTTSDNTLDREAVADRLNDLAAEIRTGDDLRVRVGNKNVTLHPPETINYRVEVIEKRKRFRGSRETIRIELDWKPE